MESITEKYKEQGIEDYYKNNSEEYSNPHEPQVKDLLIRNIGKFDCSNVLDLCCGGGEVTKVLLKKGFNNIEGADPYTSKLYIKTTKKPCYVLSFKDILRGKINKSYTSIFCSFAFHLINKKDLLMIVNELLRNTQTLILITPHKRPFIDIFDGVDLTFSDYSLTPKGKKVYLRIYKSTYVKAKRKDT